jgi:hypothetical protein
MPNIFAYAVLLVWPLVGIWLFRTRSRSSAIAWTLLAGFMLLPVRTSFDLPVLPALDKSTMPVLSAFVLALLGVGMHMSRGKAGSPEPSLPGILPQSRLILVLLLMAVFQPTITGYLNGDPLSYGSNQVIDLPGMTLYDGMSSSLSSIMALLPILIGRKYLQTENSVKILLATMMAMGLIYSIPMLIEMRLSPQLHRWLYGFFPHTDFQQTRRWGGFRPMVFMSHGLVMAMMSAMFFMAALAMLRTSDMKTGGKRRLGAIWLGVMLVLCKSVGAILYGLFAAPLLLLASKRTQLTVAAGIAIFVLCYPIARSFDVVPTQKLVALAGGGGSDRGESLEFRFKNEDMLMAKAKQRPIFGWGGWGRGRAYHPIWGFDISVTDGSWINSISAGGAIGFIARFGLLTVPILLLFRHRSSPALTLESAALCVILAFNLIDMLPNSGVTPLTFLLAGTIVGRAEAMSRAAASGAVDRAKRPGRTAPPKRGGPHDEALDPAPAPARPNGPVRPGVGGAAKFHHPSR